MQRSDRLWMLINSAMVDRMDESVKWCVVEGHAVLSQRTSEKLVLILILLGDRCGGCFLRASDQCSGWFCGHLQNLSNLLVVVQTSVWRPDVNKDSKGQILSNWHIWYCCPSTLASYVILNLPHGEAVWECAQVIGTAVIVNMILGCPWISLQCVWAGILSFHQGDEWL